jgi:hypothetical protein
VIVLPVLILSPDGASPGDKREPAPESNPLNQSTQGWKLDQAGVSTKM